MGKRLRHQRFQYFPRQFGYLPANITRQIIDGGSDTLPEFVPDLDPFGKLFRLPGKDIFHSRQEKIRGNINPSILKYPLGTGRNKTPIAKKPNLLDSSIPSRYKMFQGCR